MSTLSRLNHKPLAVTLACGYLLLYYSEFLFWARIRPGDNLTGWLLTWLVYSLLAFVLLALIAHFRIATIWGLFLAGAAFGWLAEGLVVQTAYESLPLSLSFTGLAWHALISVWVGWHAMRRALTRSGWAGARLAALIGLVYGVWAISWWVEPDGGIAPPLEFGLYSLVISLPAAAAYALLDRCLPGGFVPARAASLTAAALLFLYFVFVTVPAAPLALLILPLLLGTLYLSLRRMRQFSPDGSYLNQAGTVAPLRRYAAVLLIPLAATAVYSLAYGLGWRLQTNWLFYLVTTPLGFAALLASLVKAGRGAAQ